MVGGIGGRVGNPHPHRYKEKVEETLSEEEFLYFLQRAEDLDQERSLRRENPQHPFDHNIKNIKIAALLSLLYYTGLRVSEIVGDRPHRYFTKRGEERWTKEIHGIRKQDIRITKGAVRIDPKEILKHGRRDEPLWIPKDLPGVEHIIEQWETTQGRNDRLFPISKWTAWYLISQVTEGRLYPHYFRENRATKFAEHPKTSIYELQQWFGWVDPRTLQKYMGRGGRVTRRMAERLR